MAGGDHRVRTGLARESVRSSDSLWACGSVCSDRRHSRGAREGRMRPAEAMNKPRITQSTPSGEQLAEVTPLRQDQPTEVNPTVPAPEPARSDLDAVAELADAHRQI